MPRTLYVHIGPMKTGTSALQSVLSSHDNSIVVYPKVALWGPGSHHGLVFSFYGQVLRGKKPHDDCKELFRQIRDEAEASSLNLLISSEVLSEKKKNRDPARFVHALWDYLGRDCWRVEILLTCREHFQRAASSYSQRVKGRDSTETRGPDEYLVAYAEKLTYAPLFEQWMGAGFEVNALNYHPSETWTARFLAHLGFSTNQIPATAERNVSLSVKALIAKLSANRVLRTDKDRSTFAKLLKTMPGYYGSSRRMFSPEAMASAESRFLVDREFLIENCGIQLPEEDIAQPGTFFLDSEGLAEIATMALQLGEVGERVVQAASEYVNVKGQSES